MFGKKSRRKRGQAYLLAFQSVRHNVPSVRTVRHLDCRQTSIAPYTFEIYRFMAAGRIVVKPATSPAVGRKAAHPPNLKGPKGCADRIEHVQKQQGHVLIHVQLAVARQVMLAAGVMQALQHPGKSFEILEALKFACSYFMPFLAHGRHLNREVRRAQA